MGSETPALLALRSLSLVPPPHPLLCLSSTLISTAVNASLPLFVFCIKFFIFTDLYGTEDLSLDPTTENVKAEHQENSFSPEHHTPTRITEPAVKHEHVAAPPPSSSVATPPAPITSWSEPPSSAAERAAPPQATNVLQQIPTYQESDSDDRGSSRSTYHGVAVEERSVRPSEMKDEG